MALPALNTVAAKMNQIAIRPKNRLSASMPRDSLSQACIAPPLRKKDKL